MNRPLSFDQLIADAGAWSDVGPIRADNEDLAFASAPVFLVADGMGGHGAGREAAAAAIAPFRALAGGPAVDLERVYRAMRDAVSDVDRLADQVLSRRSPGTTLTGLILVRVAETIAWLVLNLGDSRTYRFTEGQLTLVTQDHSEVGEALRAGELTPAQALHHPRRNVVTRALGRGISNLPDYELARVRPGERWLVCSDGLSGSLSESQLVALLGGGMGAEDTARALVLDAIATGSQDNATALVVDVAADVSTGSLDDDTVRRGPRQEADR